MRRQPGWASDFRFRLIRSAIVQVYPQINCWQHKCCNFHFKKWIVEEHVKSLFVLPQSADGSGSEVICSDVMWLIWLTTTCLFHSDQTSSGWIYLLQISLYLVLFNSHKQLQTSGKCNLLGQEFYWYLSSIFFIVILNFDIFMISKHNVNNAALVFFLVWFQTRLV